MTGLPLIKNAMNDSFDSFAEYRNSLGFYFFNKLTVKIHRDKLLIQILQVVLLNE